MQSCPFRKFRDETGRFVLEGEKLFQEALRSGVEVESVCDRKIPGSAPRFGEVCAVAAFEIAGGAAERLASLRPRKDCMQCVKNLTNRKTLIK